MLGAVVVDVVDVLDDMRILSVDGGILADGAVIVVVVGAGVVVIGGAAVVVVVVVGVCTAFVGAIEINIIVAGVVVVVVVVAIFATSSAELYRLVVVRSILYGMVTFSSFKIFAVRFSGIFGSGFTFSIIVFFGFKRIEPFVMVNGCRVEVFGKLLLFLCVISASVFVTSNDP